MEEIAKQFFNAEFLDNWDRHYNKLEAYLNQNSNDQFSQTKALDKDLVKWIEIQSKIKNKLSFKLKSKLAALKFDFDQKDSLWEYMYQQLASFAKRNGHTHLPVEEEYELLKDWLLRQIQGKKYLSQSRYSRLNLLGVDWDMIITRDQRWEQMYFNLKVFYETFGHCQVPQRWEQDKSLANWVRVQRRNKGINKLRPERERKLNDLKFTWHIKIIYDAQWQNYFQELQQFYQNYGHCRVPGRNKQLTSWIENQRTARKNKVLSAEREQQLNKINFIWSSKEIKGNLWDEKYEQLCAFKQMHGHCFVPINYKENKSLGYWVASQRRLEESGQLKEAKKKQLSQLGFIWHNEIQNQIKFKLDCQWNNKYERLKLYQQEHGNCQVSLKINPELQRWTRWQRKLFYEGKLSEDRMTKLNEIRFPWNIQEGYWMKMYEVLTDFKQQFGHTRVPYLWKPNWQLARWCYCLKLAKPELSLQKVELLDMIGFDWQRNRRMVVSWENMYKRLLKFKQQYGHTRVPVSWIEDPKLGKWVSRMRQGKDKLLPERVALLNRITFDWGWQFANKKNE